MKDLIDRQAAIDALHMHLMYRMGTDSNKKRLDDWINSLPSAQPEKRTEKRTETHACDLIDRQAAVDAICHHLPSVSRTRARTMLHEAPSAQPEQKWIPCSERLPEVGKDVMVCYDFKGHRSVLIGVLYGDEKFHGYDDEYLTPEGRKYRKAVAWMPLPEPYREERTEE